jgi:serine/threonine protein kinase
VNHPSYGNGSASTALKINAVLGDTPRKESFRVMKHRQLDSSGALPSGSDAYANSSGDLQVGQLLRGTYLILAELDEGGMGKLYRAEHQRLHRPVAVKVMSKVLSANQEALARFRREAEIISQLDHPHIIHILDFDTTESGDPYIVMELLSGETLARRLDQIRILPLFDTVEIVNQIANALMLAHQSGIVHRDLKPDNVFLLSMQDESVFIKLLDFGISKGNATAPRVTGKYDVLGTPDYMAPEQVLNTARADHRADQWSLACITYEMLTGHIPFSAESSVQILAKVVTERPAPLTEYVPDIPKSIQDVVLRGLAKDPFQRYPTIGDFASGLARAAQPFLSPENALQSARSQEIQALLQLAPTNDAKRRQRTTRRPQANLSSRESVPAKKVTTQKLKPAKPRLRAPARGNGIVVDSSERISNRAGANAVRSLLDEVHRSVTIGDEQHAVTKARAALKLAQGDRSHEVQSLICIASDLLHPILLRSLGGQEKMVTLLHPPSSQDTSLSPDQMFLLSRIDGRTTIEELLDVSPLSAPETLGILLDFTDHGFMMVL